jgi:hypothetical protein
MMRLGSPELPIGIVFRQIHTSAEREEARSLLLATAGPSWRILGLDERCTGFGLWDLTAEGTGLVAAAVIRPVEPRVVELCAWAALAAPPWSTAGERLVREVVDTLRADGAERVVARPAKVGRHERELLHRAGFRPVRLQCLDVQVPDEDGADSAVWLSLGL